MERLMSPLKRGTKDYLSTAVVPSLVEGLTQLSILRPADPHVFLAKFLLDKSPHKDKYVLVTREECASLFAPSSKPSTPAGGGLAAVRSLERGVGVVTDAATAVGVVTETADDPLVLAEVVASAEDSVGAEESPEQPFSADITTGDEASTLAATDAVVQEEEIVRGASAAAVCVEAEPELTSEPETEAVVEAALYHDTVDDATQKSVVRPAFMGGVRIDGRYALLKLHLDAKLGSFEVTAYDPRTAQSFRLSARGLDVDRLCEEHMSERAVGRVLVSHLGLRENPDTGALVLYLAPSGGKSSDTSYKSK